MRRLAPAILFALTLVVGCRSKHAPPPPVAVVPPPAPTPSSLSSLIASIPQVSAWRYVRALGVNDTSILIAIDVTSPLARPSTTTVPPPPGLLAQTEYAVIDLARGCVVATETFPMVDEAAQRTLSPADIASVFGSIQKIVDDDAGTRPLQSSPDDYPVGAARVLPIVNGPIFREQFARKQKLFADFAINSDEHGAWSRDGTRAMFAADDEMYRSDDGTHFSLVDHNAAYLPAMSNDGKFGLYRRCTHPCGDYRLAQINFEKKSAPRFIANAEVHDFEFDPGEQTVVYAREDKAKQRICIERVTLATGAIAKVACEPTVEVVSENILTMSADASMGALETYQGPAKDPQLVVFDLRTGARLRSIPAMPIGAAVDSEGRVALGDNVTPSDTARVSDAAGFHPLGSGEVLAWDHQKRVVLLHRDVLADPSKCGAVTVVVPPTP